MTGQHDRAEEAETQGRTAIGNRLRFEIFKRDNFTCVYCGQTPPHVILNVDHVVAVASGGGNEPENLVTACFKCNNGKGARPLGTTINAIDLEEQAERAAQWDAYNEHLRERKRLRDEEIQRLGNVFVRLIPGAANHSLIRGTPLWGSISTWLGRGLPSAFIEEAFERASGRIDVESLQDHDGWDRRIRYAAGICWNLISDMEAGNAPKF